MTNQEQVLCLTLQKNSFLILSVCKSVWIIYSNAFILLCILIAIHKAKSMFKVNEYFDGNVKSIAFQTNQYPATIGVMAAGDYEFGTASIEYMTIISGKLYVLLPDNTEWLSYMPGDTFIVEANKKFKVKAEIDTAYLCIYK